MTVSSLAIPINRAFDELDKHVADLNHAIEMYKLLFEHSFCACAITKDDGIIENINIQFASLLGYKPKDLEGKHFREISAPRHNKKSEAVMKDLFAKNFYKAEFYKEYIHKDNHLVWCFVRILVARWNDVPKHMIVHIRPASPDELHAHQKVTFE